MNFLLKSFHWACTKSYFLDLIQGQSFQMSRVLHSLKTGPLDPARFSSSLGWLKESHAAEIRVRWVRAAEVAGSSKRLRFPVGAQER